MKTLLNLHQVGIPLRKASGKAGVMLALINADLKPVTEGFALPKLPASFKGGVGERIELTVPQGRLVLAGCGRADEDEARFWEVAGAAAMDALRALKIESACLQGELLSAKVAANVAAQRFATGAMLAAYRCTAYRKHLPRDHFEVKQLQLPAGLWSAAGVGIEIGAAVNWARALVDAPANLLTPQAFAQEARSLVALGVKVEVLDEKALEKIGAGGLLAVGRASEHPPCMLVCRWDGRAGRDVDLGLVGKGLTFDGGGLNLKPRPGIEKMKFDMAGAASVVGVLRVLAQRKAPVNVVAAIPLCENLIDAKAYRPGDVITSLSGLTIEVDNTDAEGRIVLADGITHLINTFKPSVLVDVATLTGAILISLHEEFAGLFTSDDALAGTIEAAAQRSGDAVWRMPLSRRQDYLVDSEIADVKNLGAPGFFGTGGGSSIAGAKFLERFVSGTRWAHLDIAGVSWATRPLPGIPKGATGYGVRLLDELAQSLIPARKKK